MPTRFAARPTPLRACPTRSARAACGRSARAMRGRASLMPRARSAFPAPWSRSRPRRRPSSTECGRSGRTIVPVSYEQAWKAAEAHAFEGMDGTFIHPFDNHDFIAGHGTMGLEIVEDLPEVRTVIAAIGGGGLITGVGSAIKALRPEVDVIGAEPETAAPYAYSLRDGRPEQVPELAGILRRRSRRAERHRADVAADGARRRSRDHRHAGSDARRDAAHRGEGARDCRRRGCAVACCGACR